ncbi:MAG TPA: hypothetical protein VNI83_08750 [Vicinamibacterales bacterium]|nr:hypothetical protein [Vicinamibacterales bacterium]
MTPAEMRALLEACYQEKLALRRRHAAAARAIASYEFNNAYQYIIAREDMHLTWLRDAIADLGGAAPPIDPTENGLPAVAGDERAILADDARLLGEFIARWRDRIEAMPHARHRTMLRLMLGEMLEQQRTFEQALAGRRDLLGRPLQPQGAAGRVLPRRWLE